MKKYLAYHLVYMEHVIQDLCHVGMSRVWCIHDSNGNVAANEMNFSLEKIGLHVVYGVNHFTICVEKILGRSNQDILV